MAWVDNWIEHMLRPLPNGKARTVLGLGLRLPISIIVGIIAITIFTIMLGILFGSVAALLSGGIPGLIEWWSDLLGILR